MSGELKIRPAREDELAVVRRLAMEELPDELIDIERGHLDEAKAAFAGRFDSLFRTKESEVYVAEAESGGGIAGFVWFGVSQRPFSALQTGWIYDIQVVPEHRGKGVGEALLKQALGRAKERGFELTGLMVRASNEVAYSLYEKLGFKPEHVIMTRRETESFRSPASPARE